MNNYKIICTGNPNKVGIANAVFKAFPDTTFISLSTGYDLLSEEGQSKFRKIIKDYNVFINGSPGSVTGDLTGNVTGDLRGNLTGYAILPSSAPVTPAAGTMYFDSATNLLYVYNGTAWRSVSLA